MTFNSNSNAAAPKPPVRASAPAPTPMRPLRPEELRHVAGGPIVAPTC